MVMGKDDLSHEAFPLSEAQYTDIMGWEPRPGMENERLTPTKDLKGFQIGPLAHQVKKIETSFSKEEERELID